mmetsp:Transcript_30170/g.59215  ORF Transcript_30170/g.59215 Transcript_30170/m.59215 type:complete len:497 (-) Transcript_30170:79-1569(-)
MAEPGHLSNATSVIGDGTVGVDSQGHGQSAQHTEGRQGNSIHAAERVCNQGGGTEAENGDDSGGVSDGKTGDDTSGSGSGLCARDGLDGVVRVGGVVLGDVPDDETRPETHAHCDAGVKPGHSVELSIKGKGVREHELGKHDDGGGLEDGGDDKDSLEGLLDIGKVLHGVDVLHQKHGDQTDNDTRGGEHQREHQPGPGGGKGIRQPLGGTGNNQSGAGGLGKGAEKIGAHTGDVSDVITDVVGNAGGVSRVVLVDVEVELAGKIGTHICGLGVDPSTHTGEQGNGGTAETIPGNGLEHMSVVTPEANPRHLVDLDEDPEDGQTDRHKAKAHDGTGIQGNIEGRSKIVPSLISGPHICKHGNAHANESANTGCDGTDNECNHGADIDKGSDNTGEENNVHCEVLVLLVKESVGTRRNQPGDVLHGEDGIGRVSSLLGHHGFPQSTSLLGDLYLNGCHPVGFIDAPNQTQNGRDRHKKVRNQIEIGHLERKVKFFSL